MAENQKSAGNELFNLLNRDYVTLTSDDKTHINEILTADNDVLKSKDFLQPLSGDISASERTLKTLEQLGGESTASEIMKTATDTVAKSVLAYREGTWKDPYQKEPAAQPQQPQQSQEQQLPAGGEKTKETDKPRGTLSVEQLREGAYRGTLTAEQQDQLKKIDDKKVANLENVDGDRNLSKKRDPAKDKFREEDVVKYMYEEWFLAGASWLFNKTEDFLLGSIDTALDKATRRHQTHNPPKTERDTSELNAAIGKSSQLAQITQQNMQNLSAQCDAKKTGLQEHLDDLSAYVRGEKTIDELKGFKEKDDAEFLGKLQKNPNAGEFLHVAEKRIAHDLKLIESTGKLSYLMTSIEMTDELMRNDKTWRVEDDKKRLFGKKPDQPYKDIETLKEELQNRTLTRHEKILEAVAVISEDARLHAEIAYDQMKDKPANKGEFILGAVTSQVSSFLKELESKTIMAAQKQKESVEQGQFNVVGKQPDKKVKGIIKDADELIDQKIQYGEVFNEKGFNNGESSQRVTNSQSLFTAALQENTPQGVKTILETMTTKIDLDLAQNQTAQAANDARKKSFEAMKARILKKEGQKTFDSKIAAMTAQQKSGSRN